eukprot:CAMPEP_0202923504 /NCGR_PEP_ID=MMETSP1392-20130828/78483_1 /ASSEMBLY_ACC=CAM_ASM_000868 /TAXON_ID=225041 /ORGANISM="Chlamydomonas chlamydogama, Strain SAG 11-48b" /LENGTH=219 /DNA_ID=CAMNT_0049617187 /DNA_START=458 /DNA_END=1117 /DNA_ORIENTATION=+
MLVNERITAKSLKVHLPNASSKIMTRDAALEAAKAAGLDLVMLVSDPGRHADKAGPPEAHMTNAHKLKYESQQAHGEEKREALKKQKQEQELRPKQEKDQKADQKAAARKADKVKEMRFTPRIGPHDVEHKMRSVKGWLEDGHRVALAMEVKGDAAEIAQDASRVLDSLVAKVTDVASANKEKSSTKYQGRTYMTVWLRPLAKTAAATADKQQQAKQKH